MTFGNILKYGLVAAYSMLSTANHTAAVTIKVVAIVLCCLIGYFLGSINFAIIISKNYKHDDVREHGSKNAGATNMLRTYGKKAAFLTFAGDFLKAIIACFLGGLLFGHSGLYLAGLFCVLGHIFPIFYKFKGGKGVATIAGVMCIGNIGAFAVVFLLYAGVFLISKYVSLASVMCAFMYPFILNRMDILFNIPPDLHIIFAMAMSILVIIKHIPNINRILNQTEPKTYLSKKKRAEEKAKVQAQTKNKKSLHSEEDL